MTPRCGATLATGAARGIAVVFSVVAAEASRKVEVAARIELAAEQLDP